jgi:hypothetical protein
VADLLCAEEVDRRRRGNDRRAREESGELRTRPRVFRSSNKPNDLILLAEYEEAARARQLFQSAEFREATQRAGVAAPPEVTRWPTKSIAAYNPYEVQRNPRS